MTLLLSSCGTQPVFVEEKDRGPDRPVSVGHIDEPVPKVEPRTRAGNSSPYKVLGKTYHVLQSPDGYKAKGVASWYGKKFHGRRTANGEVYDMYAMTAAHKTLPIPSYVRVTNIANRRSIIVRVNDRGPFHGDRLIDLSYTAAKKLGFENTGTANVTIEYIDPLVYQKPYAKETEVQLASAAGSTKELPAPTPERSGGYQLPPDTWLQVGAFSEQAAALKMKVKLESMTHYPVVIFAPEAKAKDKLFRVRVGPLKDNFDLLELRKQMQEQKLPDPHVIYN